MKLKKIYIILLTILFSTFVQAGVCSEHIGGSSSGWLGKKVPKYSIENSSRTSSRALNWVKVGKNKFTKFVKPYRVNYNYAYHGKKGTNPRHRVSIYGDGSSPSAEDHKTNDNYGIHLLKSSQTRNLNYYSTNDADARDGDYYTVFYNPPIKSSSNRYVLLTERNLNNGQRVIAVNSTGHNVGNMLKISKTGYQSMGVNVAIGSIQQTLGGRVAPLTSLVSAGTLIYGLRIYQYQVNTRYYGDGADGKVIMMAEYLPCTIDAVDNSPSKLFMSRETTHSFLNNDYADKGVEATSSNVVVSTISRGGLPVGTYMLKDGRIYIGDKAENGTYPFKYEICLKKDTSICDTAIVNVKIFSEAKAVDDSVSLFAGPSSYIDVDVMANDYPTDSTHRVYLDEIFTTGEDAPKKGTISIVGGKVRYTPTPGKFGEDKFLYKIYSTSGDSDLAWVYVDIKVLPIVAVDDTGTMEQDEELTIDVVANDTSTIPEDTFKITSVTQGGDGKVTIVGNKVVYLPRITFVGTDTFTYTIINAYGASDTATVRITVTKHDAPGIFEQKYTKNLKGNILFIGNTNGENYGRIPWPYSRFLGKSAKKNNDASIRYTNSDTDPSTFNSSEATIASVVDGVPVDKAKIIWAGIFWYGTLHNDQANYGIDSVYRFPKDRNAALDPMYREMKNHKIKITFGKGESAVSHYISEEEISIEVSNGATGGYWGNRKPRVYWEKPGGYWEKPGGYWGKPGGYWGKPGGYWGKPGGYWGNRKPATGRFSAFTEITDLLKDQSPNQTYTVANIPSREGRGKSGWWPNESLSPGMWTMAIVYDNRDEVLEKTRNVNVYSGKASLNSGVYPTKEKGYKIKFDNFRTPSYAPNGVDATFTALVLDGDRGDKGDQAHILTKDANGNDKYFKINDGQPTNDHFNSSIINVDDRKHKVSNNFGMDLHNHKLGTNMGSNMPIKAGMSEAQYVIHTKGESILPRVIGLGIELYRPRICYDYDLFLGNSVKIASKDREINTNGYGKNLMMRIFLRSELADFDFTNVVMDIKFKPDNAGTDKISYIKNSSFISQPRSNSYVSVPDQSASGRIPMGTLTGGKTIGTIGALESTYSKQEFSIPNGFNGDFDIQINGNILYNNTDLIDYNLSTSGVGQDLIEPCDTNPVYEPVWGAYNIERTDANPQQADHIRYPLYTQVTGKDFAVDIASYTKDGAGNYTFPRITNTIVEVDMIDASLFKNTTTSTSPYNIYDASCENPEIFGGSKMVTFNNTDRVRLNIPEDIPNFNNDMAMKNVAFRVWYLGNYEADYTFSIVEHMCGFSGDCFRNLYTSDFRANDGGGICLKDCSISYGAKKCYDCLKDNFAKPVCSRDNFAIRPASFRMKLSDNNETTAAINNVISQNDTGNTIKLSGEYDYNMDITPTMYGSNNIAYDYYNFNFIKEDITVVDPLKEEIILESKNIATCNDLDSHTFEYHFIESKIFNDKTFNNGNVGQYQLSMLDNSWTEVDQIDYKYKTLFNGIATADCIKGGSNNDNYLVGCDIDSSTQDNFELMNIKFNPYGFNFDTVDIDTLPWHNSRVLMTDFTDLYYDTNPISVATELTGEFSAIGKKGNIMTNFTDKCYSEDVNIEVFRETTPEAEADLFSTKGYTNTKNIVFQQYLKKVYSAPEIVEGIGNNVTLPKAEFDDLNPGVAPLSLFFTFKKTLNATVLPIRVDFEKVEASSPTADSYADEEVNHIPVGERDYNAEVDYYFAKVTPYKKLYGPTIEKKIQTPLSVDIYCLDTATLTCLDFGLNSPTVGVDEDQYSWFAADIFGVNNLGFYDLDSKVVSGTNVSFVESTETNSDTGIDFNDPVAVQKEIEAGLTNTITGPTTVKIEVQPEPWLLYDANNVDGYPTYKINHIIETSWTGVGKTGQVIGGTSDRNNKRSMRW